MSHILQQHPIIKKQDSIMNMEEIELFNKVRDEIEIKGKKIHSTLKMYRTYLKSQKSSNMNHMLQTSLNISHLKNRAT